ncbi:MAG: sugar ABC transporter ATP-binding protein [Thermomicrobiales bacterium]
MTDTIIPDSPERSHVPTETTEPILVFRGLTKRFGGATALNNVDFDLMPGEIHGLVGENGAGKSTMMKILSGLHTPDEGEMLLRGEAVQFTSPADAKARGIGMIYQELSCMPALSVAENVFLGSQPTKGGLVDWGTMRREAKTHLGAMGINVDVTAPASTLSLGGQQLVEISRVVFSGASIIVLDEPTSALSGPESERLFRAMAELKARGTTLVFISHFLEDVLAVSDRITVLKNSRKIATLENRGVTKQQLIQLMIGRDAEVLAEGYEGGVALPAPATGKPALELQGLSGEGFTDLSLTAHQGEILGIFGNLGAGMTEMARVIFGRERPTAGTMLLEGQPITPKNTKASKQLGIAYLSENRRATIFPRHEIFKNITLAHLDDIVGAFVRQPKEVAIATDLVKRTGVRPARPTLAAGNLSGGNQQKVVLAKWLTVQPKVLILNEPTRGMDVGAKREVLDLVKALRNEGVSIILISTEPETVLAESDRILVMSKGQITKEFVGERVSKDLLMSYA